MYIIKLGLSWINLEHVQRVQFHAGGGCSLTMMQGHQEVLNDRKEIEKLETHLKQIRRDKYPLQESHEDRMERLNEYEAP